MARSCPICAAPAAPRPENKFAPFCSERCKLIDLGKWLNEEYVISRPLGPAPPEAPPRDDED